MRRVVPWVLVLCASAFGAASCATYAQDLDRARNHYNTNRYEQALALFRVLEDDMDSYSAAEQAQYAYLRGMTDYRLAEISPKEREGRGITDPRQVFRDNARHWLGVSAAIEKETPGGITGDEAQRRNEALNDLNRDVFGGAEPLTDATSDAPAAASAGPGAPASPAASAGPGAPASPAAPAAAPASTGAPGAGPPPPAPRP